MTTDSVRTRIKPTAGVGGAEIGRCLTKAHHDRFTPAVSQPDPVADRRARDGIDHEARIVTAILDTFEGSFVDLRRGANVYERTTQALNERVELIVGGRITTADGRLVGAPDILVLTPDGYAPIEIKGHLIIGHEGPRCAVAPLADFHTIPPIDEETPVRFRGNRKRDLYQVAHYWRILDGLGHAIGPAMGGVIGTEDPPLCAWVALDTEDRSLVAKTSDRTDELLNALEEGLADPSTPSVDPFWRGECGGCVWHDLCHAQLTERNDPTLLQGIDAASRATLAEAGITTIEGVAGLSADTDLVREGSVILQARARTFGGLLRRDASDRPVDVPSPNRQVDFDIETYRGRIYLAGFLETVEGSTSFDPVVDWSGAEGSERRLIGELFDRLAAYAHADTKVFYWTGYEPTTLARAAATHDLQIPGYDTVGEWFDAHAIDLHRWTKDRFISPFGYGLKAVAPLCGFTWRDDDPGGQQSELWYEDMVAGDVELKDRLLAYNEDDVEAQLVIRRWIVEQDTGAGPGTAIPSVMAWPLD